MFLVPKCLNIIDISHYAYQWTLFLPLTNNGCFIFTKIKIKGLSLWSFSEYCEAKYLALEINTTNEMHVSYFSALSSYLKTVSYLTTLAYNINFDTDKCTQEVISH